MRHVAAISLMACGAVDRKISVICWLQTCRGWWWGEEAESRLGSVHPRSSEIHAKDLDILHTVLMDHITMRLWVNDHWSNFVCCKRKLQDSDDSTPLSDNFISWTNCRTVLYRYGVDVHATSGRRWSSRIWLHAQEVSLNILQMYPLRSSKSCPRCLLKPSIPLQEETSPDFDLLGRILSNFSSFSCPTIIFPAFEWHNGNDEIGLDDLGCSSSLQCVPSSLDQ